nr:MAG TPA: hypothetical protein [Bacteriophage sp.]
MQNNRERRNGMENILFSPPLQEAVALRIGPMSRFSTS